MNVTRRGFIGVLSVAPAFGTVLVGEGLAPTPVDTRPIEQEAIKVETDAGEGESISSKQFGYEVFRLLRRQIRDLRVVGHVDSQVGHVWGSGIFDKQIHGVLPDLRITSRGLVRDRVLMQAVVNRMADRMRSESIKHVGRLPLPFGPEANIYTTRHLSMRALFHYQVHTDTFIGRFDVLGSTT